MNSYNPETAREIYKKLQDSPQWDFPITAVLVDGILENFVYGTHDVSPYSDWETLHLNIPWEILILPSWSGWIREQVQNIIDTQKNRAVAA